MRLLCPAILAVAGAFSLPVDAAETPPPPLTVSTPAATTAELRAALRLVWTHSPDVATAQAELTAAQARARAADQPLYNPTLSVDGENADVDRRTASVGLALDFSGKRGARAAEGQAEVRIAEGAFELARRDVAARWLKAWSATALAVRQTQFGQRRVDLMQRFDDLAAQRLKVGDISSPERDLAGLALGEAQIQQATLLSREAQQSAALMAIAGDTVPQVAVPDALPPDVADVSVRDVLELPELRVARARIERGDAAIEVARRNRIPDPTVSLTGGRVRSGLFGDRVTDRVIGVSVSIPLPILNTGRHEVSAAQAEADVASASMRAQDLTLRAAQRETRARYEAMRTASLSFRGGRAGALDDRTALLEKLWRAGEISTSDYLVQLKQSLDTALSGVDLESQTWQAWFDYLAAAGRLTDWVEASPSKDANP